MSIADMLNGLSDIVNGKRTENTPPAAPIPKIPDQIIGVPGYQVPVLGTEWARQASTQIPKMAEGLAAGATDLYGLLNHAAKWAFGSESDVLPGAETAGKISDTIHTAGRNINEWQLDEPRNENLLSGTPPEIAANWAGLGASILMRAPAAVMSEVDKGIKMLEASKGLAARTGEYAAKALEMVTPVMVRTPTPAIEAGSLAIGAGLGAGFELAFPDPDVKRIDEARQQATASAVNAAEATAPAVDVVDKAANPVKAAFSTGNDWLDGAIVSAAVLGGFAYMKRDAMARVLGAMGKEEPSVLKASETLRTNIVDRTEPLKTTYGTIHPQYKERWANQVDQSNGAAIDTKLRSVFDYGEIPDSAVKLPAVRDLYTMMGKAGQDAVDVAERAIASRREYFDDAARAVRSATDRANDWQLGQANPIVKQIVDQYDVTMKKMLDYAVEQRYLSPQRAAEIINDNLHQFPKRLAEESFSTKVPKKPPADPENIFSRPAPLQELPQFIEKVMRDVEWNKTTRAFINEMRAAAASGNKYAQEIVGRAGVSRRNVDNLVTFRDFNGKVDTQEILDPLVRRAIGTGDDQARLHALSGNFAFLARQFEQAATGKYATAALQPFSPIAAIYNAGFGSAIRPSGVRAGWIDKALQDAGFKFGLPGDLTILGDSAFRAAQGVKAVVVKRAADALHSSVIRDGIMANALGPQNADRMATALSNQFKRSWVHEFQQEGLLGPAAYGGYNPDQMIKQAIAAMQPAGLPRRVVRETLGFLDDITHAVSASPTASIWALNANLPRDLRARAVREFTGDPSRGGAFVGRLREGQLPGETIGKLTAATPWGNIYLQSMDRFARALKKNPMSVLTGVSMSVGLPVIAASMRNASLGPEYSDYEYNRRGPDRKAASIYVALPGLPPENGLEIPVDPLMRPYALAMHLMVGSKLGLMDGTYFAPENATMANAFGSMTRNAWYKDVPLSVLQQSVLPPVPVGGQVGLAAAGINWRGYGELTQIHRRNDTGYTESDAKDPFRDFMGLKESAVAENVVRSLGANAGAMAYNLFWDSSKRINEGEGDTVAKNAWQTIKLGMRDSAKPVSGLLGAFASVSPSQEAAGKLVQEKVDGLKHLGKALDAITKNGALTGGDIVGSKQRGYQALLGGTLAVEPNDPRMLEFSSYAKYQLQLIEQQFLGANKDDYAQRASLQASTQYSPERKRAMMNELSGQITERNRQLLVLLQQFEAQMRAKFGVPIQLEKVKVGKGMEQFSE